MKYTLSETALSPGANGKRQSVWREGETYILCGWHQMYGWCISTQKLVLSSGETAARPLWPLQ